VGFKGVINEYLNSRVH